MAKNSASLSSATAVNWKEKMRVKVVNVMTAVLATVVFGMMGCGGGGGESTPTVANTNTYSTAKILPLTASGTTTFTLTGSDTSGGSWSGSVQTRGDGSTVFEGQNVSKVSQIVTLSLAGSSTASSTVAIASYYKSDGLLYKAVYSGSTSGTALQTNSAILPATFKVGDFASGPSLSLNLNGTTDSVTTTYQVFDAGNGNARVVSTMTYQVASYSATTEYIISPSGDMLLLKMILYYPSLNKTVTLNVTTQVHF